MNNKKEITSKNPCLRECQYNDENICIACHRTKKEIFEWGGYSHEKRIEINTRIKKEFSEK